MDISSINGLSIAEVIVPLLYLWIPPILSQEPMQVNYIKSPIYGNQIMAPGKKLASDFIDYRIQNSSICNCNRICLTLIACKAFSLDKANECQISKLPPYNVTLEDEVGATYIYNQDSLEGKLNELKEDNYWYYIGPDKLTHEEATQKCLSIPGYQLGTFKTEQQLLLLKEIIGDLGVGLFIDLFERPSGGEIVDNGYVWGDGTPLDPVAFNLGYSSRNNDATNIVRVESNFLIDDLWNPIIFNYLCQAKLN